MITTVTRINHYGLSSYYLNLTDREQCQQTTICLETGALESVKRLILIRNYSHDYAADPAGLLRLYPTKTGKSPGECQIMGQKLNLVDLQDYEKDYELKLMVGFLVIKRLVLLLRKQRPTPTQNVSPEPPRTD